MRKVFVSMLLAALVLALSFAADKPPEHGVPEHYSTYGKARSQQLYRTCVSAGNDRFTPDSISKYCACHVYIMEEIIPLPELLKLSQPQRRELWGEIHAGCLELGLGPVLAPPKKIPNFDLKKLPSTVEL